MDRKFDIVKLSILNENCYSQGRKDSIISTIILHCFGQSLEEILPIFNSYEVSAHYIIPQMTGRQLQDLLPKIYDKLNLSYREEITLNYPDATPVIQLVEDCDRAFHAGISHFGSLNHSDDNSSRSLNYISLGIEFQSPGYGKEGEDFYHFSNFSAGQRETGLQLIEFLAKTYSIPYQNFLAHSTIAPGRKTDPGPNFFWKELTEAGFSYLPPIFEKGLTIDSLSPDQIKNLQNKLQKIGFIDCPVNGLLDAQTHANLDAYILQFASYFWEHKNNPLSEGLLNSIEAFDWEFQNI